MPNFYNPRLVWSIVAFASVILLVFFAITVWNAWTAYDVAHNNAERRTATTVDLLHQQIKTTIETSELVLDGMVTHGNNEQIEGSHGGISHDGHLMLMASHIPFSPWLVQIDAGGRLHYMENAQKSGAVPTHHQPAKPEHQNPAHDSSMNPGRPKSTTEVRPVDDHEAYTAYLDMHRDQIESRTLLGPPISKTFGEGWYLGLSRKITAPDGTFAGVAIVMLDASFLKVLVQSVDLGPGSEMGLLDRNGAPLVWLAFDQGTVNFVSSSSTRFTSHTENSPSGTVRVPGTSDGKDYILSYRRFGLIDGLTAAVSISVPAIDDQWLSSRIKDILLILGFGAILCLMAGFAFHLIVRPLRRIQDALNNVRDGNFEESMVVTAGVREINDVMTGVEEMRRSLKTLTDNLKIASRAKSAFLANMSHELRTPLNAILGYSEMLLEDAEDEGANERIDDLRKVHRSGRHLLGLITDILDISKIEAGKIELNIDPVDLAELLSDVENAAAPLMESNDNNFQTVVSEDIGRIECDDQRLRQVLLNLLSNAAKFTENGAIDLTVARSGDGWVRFAVTDTGIGMSAEQTDRLFEPFVQADSSITQRFGGTGLGLAISQGFVEMMGGRITIESELGAGSCFTVWLPDIEPAAQDSARQGDEPLILVIDDSYQDSSLLERYLMSLGYQVEVARDGEQGMACAQELRPAAIILDIELPSMDGYQVLKALQADETLRSLPVVVVTVHDARHIAMSLGARSFLTKPVDRDALQLALSECCEKPSEIAATA